MRARWVLTPGGKFGEPDDADCEDDASLKPGLYHYRTTDGGRTWTAPQFEPNGTRPADDVPEDEQPGQGQLAGMTR